MQMLFFNFSVIFLREDRGERLLQMLMQPLSRKDQTSTPLAFSTACTFDTSTLRG